jgi:predicted alpha-1,2-mannosidase
MTRVPATLVPVLLAMAMAAACDGSGGAPVPGDADATLADVAGDADTDGEVAPGPRTVDLVDPRIGTGGRGWWAGNAFVGAVAPFGMVQAGPDATSSQGGFPWNHCSGYHADDDTITAFSHTHLHATGIPDGGAIGFMPVAGSMTPERAKVDGYASRFDHATEVARPGYYAVTLDDQGIRVELTATDVAAHHRYTPLGPSAPQRITVVVDVAHTLLIGLVKDGAIEVDAGTGEVAARALLQGEFSATYGGMTTWVSARFDRPPVAWGTWSPAGLAPSVASQAGPRTGAWLEFDVSDGGPLEVQVGVSFVDAQGAKANRVADLPAWDFDATAASAADRWEAALSKVRFEGGTDEQRTIMATALYHALLMPSRFTDADGRYTGFDLKVHDAGDRLYYSSFSLWDTYRTLHSWLDLVEPERQRDMVQSLVRMYEQGGCIPRWPYGVGESSVMIGTPADMVIAESHLKGITGFDVDKAYEGMRKMATEAMPDGSLCQGRNGFAEWASLGYVATDRADQAVSRTLEYAIADFAVSNLAAALGHADDASLFAGRAGNWKNLWSDKLKLFVPRRADGTLVEDIDPLNAFEIGGDRPYTEGDAIQYRWLVPHDMAGLRDAFGSAEAMLAALSEFFDNAVPEQAAIFSEPHDDVWWMTNPPKWYWHGNEPDIHAAYMFLEAGRPDLTHKWVRWIADTLYTTAPDGIPGNDDCGTLSAWWIFSSLGFYPVPGSDRYLVGTPFFPRAEVDLAGGTLVVEAPAVSATNIHVQSVTIDGKPLAEPWFRHADIAGGALLRFEMGPAPSASD